MRNIKAERPRLRVLGDRPQFDAAVARSRNLCRHLDGLRIGVRLVLLHYFGRLPRKMLNAMATDLLFTLQAAPTLVVSSY